MPTTNYIWDEQNYLAETDENNVVQTVYTNEPQQYGNLISSRISGTTSYHHFDALGSTRQLTNAAGTVTDSAIYDAWGNVVSRTGTTGIVFLWVGVVGYYFDVETGHFYVRARIYGPTIGRWTAKDAARRAPEIMRPYAYCGNSPVSRVDPSGLLDWETYPGPVPPFIDWGFLDDRFRGTRIVGFCGAFVWITQWILGKTETDGFIAQRVCQKEFDVHDCPRAQCNPRPLPGACTNTGTCDSECYIELWGVRNSKIFVNGIFNETPVGEGNNDIFGYFGCTNSCSNGCTRGKIKRTGEAFFVPLNSNKTDVDWLRQTFSGGVVNACALASACDVNDIYATLSGMKKGQITKKSVEVNWNCCCPQPPCECKISEPKYSP